jgi:hypothetical protein
MGWVRFCHFHVRANLSLPNDVGGRGSEQNFGHIHTNYSFYISRVAQH